MTTPNYKRRSRLYYMARQQSCPSCGKRLCFQETTLDHIYPKSLGGPESYTNYQIMCGPCNNMKGCNVIEEMCA